jgi:serine phosphatase RsbU (regulator of sigma subunit)
MPTQPQEHDLEPKRARAWSGRFWHGITEGLELQELWTQFKSDTRASYGFYSAELDEKSIAESKRWRRPFVRSRLLFWILIQKLSPARRLLLLIALGFVTIAIFDLRLFGLRQEALFIIATAALVLLLALELADRVTMKRDLEIARGIQRWLLPAGPPHFPGLDVAFSTRPANTVGGDYYDAFRRREAAREEESLLFVIADVAGKSVPAAILMARFQASLRTLAAGPTSLDTLVCRINEQVCGYSLDGRRFTTAFLGEYTGSDRKLRYACAGHPGAMVRRRAGGIDRLDCGGLPLGIDPEARYEVGSARLDSGDTIVIFTDGMFDALDEDGFDYGEGRLLASVTSLRTGSADEALRQLMQRLETFVGAARQFDDITCMVVRAT